MPSYSTILLQSAILVALLIQGQVEGKFIDDLKNYTFEKFIKDFNFQYQPSELPLRAILFAKELARVITHNDRNRLWKEGVNKFTAMTEQEKKQFMGRKKPKNTLQHAQPLPENFVIRDVKDLPKNVDWRQAGVVSSVKDQGSCGSCWAFASTATLESHVALSSGLLFDLSTQQMAMCAPNTNDCGGTGQCQGSTAELAFEYVMGSAGMYQEFQYSYNSYYGTNYPCKTPQNIPGSPVATIDGYVKLPDNNYTVLMNAIASVGPVAINVDATPWAAYSSGIFEGCEAVNPDINHVVVMVGYGEEEDGKKYWLVRNSWSPAWGEAGYIRLTRHDDDDIRCKMDVTPQDGVACEGQDEPVKVCGMCGAIYDSSYPLNARAL